MADMVIDNVASCCIDAYDCVPQLSHHAHAVTKSAADWHIFDPLDQPGLC